MSTEYYFRDPLEGTLNMTMNGATFTAGDGAEILDYCRAHPDDVVADSEYYDEEVTGARIVSMAGESYEQVTDARIVEALHSYGWM